LTTGSIAIGERTHVAEEAFGKAVCATKTDLLIAVTIVGVIWETGLDALELVVLEDATGVATSVIASGAVRSDAENGAAVFVVTSAVEREVMGVSVNRLASDFDSDVTTTVTVEAVAFGRVEIPGALATLVVGIALKTVADDGDDDDATSDALVRTELVPCRNVFVSARCISRDLGARHAPRHRTCARASEVRGRGRMSSSRGSDRRTCRSAP
jgi:hypothetical protein